MGSLWRSIILAAAVAASSGIAAEDFSGDAYGVVVQTDVVYGQGLVGATGPAPIARDLKLDVYRPVTNGKQLADRPAVILAFGGAFHRGSKGKMRFEEDGASDSSMGEWCEAFAAAGYVCLSIEYRLVPEDPAIPTGIDPSKQMSKRILDDPMTTGRVNVVRQRMGLPVLDDRSREQLWNTMFASAQDLGTAVAFARSHAEQYGLDPERIAIGGFSAGAYAAINAAYGMGEPVQAVIAFSGGVAGYDLARSSRAGMPPGLFVVGQNDLAGIVAGTRFARIALDRAGVPNELAWMPGFGHFYPMAAPSLGSDGIKLTLKARAVQFLDRTIGGKP